MAKFYGIAGTRRGSVGNETYYISKTQNIVKKKSYVCFLILVQKNKLLKE